jgi:hypothetical protein
LVAAIMLPAANANAAKLSKMPKEAQDAISAMTKALAPMSEISLKDLSESANFSYDKSTKSWTAKIWEYNLFLMEVQVKKPKGKGTKKAYNVAVHLDNRTIKPKAEPWSKIAGVGMINPIFTYGKQTKTIKIAALPPKLRAAATQLHPRGFPMVSGLQLTAGVNPSSTRGTMLGDAFTRIDKAEAGRRGAGKDPLYVLRTGVEKAAKAKKGKTSGKFKKAKKNNAFIELTRRGTWPKPLDMPLTQLINATFYFDKDQTFGFWGTLLLQKRPAPGQKPVGPNFVAMAYKGPVSPKVTPAQLKSIQIGFGAPQMTLETFGRLMIASGYMQSAGLTAIAPLIRQIQGPAANTIISGMQVLPLDALKVTNPAWGKQRFPSASFNGRYVDAALYNVLFLVPGAKNAPKGVTPPAVRLSGTMNVLGKKIARTSTVFDRQGLKTSSSAGIKIPLGKIGGMNLGNPGVTAQYTVAVTQQQQAMAMGGKMTLPGKFGSVNFGYAITNAGGYFTTPATCAFPFEITSTMPASFFKPQFRQGRLHRPQLDSSNPLAGLAGTFRLSIPDTIGNMASCAGDLFYMVVDGALVAFNKAGEVAKVAVGAAVDGAQEVAAFGGAAAAFGGAQAKKGVVKLVPGGKVAYRAAQKTGGNVGRYAKYTAIETSKNARNVFGGGAKAFGQFAKNPNQSFKNGMKTFNKGWKMATSPRKTASKAAKTTKKTGKKALKELKKLCPFC